MINYRRVVLHAETWASRYGGRPGRHGDSKAPVDAPKAFDIGPQSVAPDLMCVGRERVKQRRRLTRTGRTHVGAASPAPPSKRGDRCRQVSKESEAIAMDRQPDPGPRNDSAAISMGCYCWSLCPSVQMPSPRSRAKCAQRNPEP